MTLLVHSYMFDVRRPILISFLHVYLGLPYGLLSSRFPTKTLHSFLIFQMRFSWPTHMYNSLIDEPNI